MDETSNAQLTDIPGCRALHVRCFDEWMLW